MGSIIRNTSRGQLIALNFGQDTVAASQTDAQLNVTIGEASQAVDGYEAVWDGEVVGMGWSLSAAGSAGVFTIGATIDGTEDADTTLTVGTAANGSLRVPRSKCKFVRGQQIGAEITTDGSWNGTSSDLSVQVYVLYQLDGI